MRDASHGRARIIITASLFGGFVAGCANRMPPAPADAGAMSGGQNPAPVVAASHQPAASAPVAEKLGPGYGWIVGASPQLLAPQSAPAAREANRRAEQHPADTANVEASPTADLNQDGFVTVDEILAMKRAGLTDSRMIQRLGATGQGFSASDRQQQYLRDRGIDQSVIDAMLAMKPPVTASSH